MLILSMAVFGTLGPFVRSIPVSSGELALYRACMAALLIGGWLLLTGQSIGIRTLGRELPALLISGAAMGVNWILPFEAYRYTSVAVATLCYYFAPSLIVVASAVFYKERMTLRTGLCALAALAGMALVSDVFRTGFSGGRELISARRSDSARRCSTRR